MYGVTGDFSPFRILPRGPFFGGLGNHQIQKKYFRKFFYKIKNSDFNFHFFYKISKLRNKWIKWANNVGSEILIFTLFHFFSRIMQHERTKKIKKGWKKAKIKISLLSLLAHVIHLLRSFEILEKIENWSLNFWFCKKKFEFLLIWGFSRPPKRGQIFLTIFQEKGLIIVLRPKWGKLGENERVA